MTISDLPTLNVTLNFISFIALLTGYLAIKNGRQTLHQCAMLTAVVAASGFLTSYIVYHLYRGSVPYPLHDWTRILYFSILIPHTIMAVLVIPGIIRLLWFAGKGNFVRHKALARLVWPAWVFVSLSGIAVYFLLFVHALGR